MQWHDNLPDRWKKRLHEYIHNELGRDDDRLGAADFHYFLSISFSDGSYAFFRGAFYIVDKEVDEIAVFTEHCGYHIFPRLETRLSLYSSVWSELNMI